MDDSKKFSAPPELTISQPAANAYHLHMSTRPYASPIRTDGAQNIVKRRKSSVDSRDKPRLEPNQSHGVQYGR
ncbi:MAG: hypothetical protein ACI9DC_005501 [Gammaproteobacteria bacterium]|jgi:hypothetical protein